MHQAVADGPPAPPRSLRQGDLPFWNAIMRQRAYMDWTELDLELACQLARLQNDLAKARAKLSAQGPTVPGQHGVMKANPLVGIVKSMTMEQLAIMRGLRLAGRADGDQPETAANRARRQREIEEAKKQVEQESNGSETPAEAETGDEPPLLA